jgi:5-methyltetrahydrofolate--homocysteine methyltransferase
VKLVKLAEARANAQAGTDDPAYVPPKPANWACRCWRHRPGELVDYIDWGPFFQTWDLAGSYPKILDDERSARRRAACSPTPKAMLKRIVDEKWLTANAVFGLFPANAVGDDIEIYADESRQHG